MIHDAIRPGMIPFWLFNDGSSTAEKLRYLRACRKGGIRSLVMHCRSGNLVPYASAEWYSTVRRLVAEARRLDMRLWLYDEDPYPSGAAGGQVMAARADLKAAQWVLREPPAGLTAGQLWEISVQPVAWAGLVPVHRPLPPLECTAQVGTIRRDWFVTPWDSRHYYPATPSFPCVRGDAIRQVYALRVPSIPPGYKLAAIVRELCGTDGSWGSLPDCLHPDTFPTFRTLSLDPYRAWVGNEFGRVIPGIFTDEAKPHGFWPVTSGVFESFRLEGGFDLKPRLHQLFGEPLSGQYVETRLAYRAWIARRFIDVFMAPYRRWCEECGLTLAGHMSPEDDPLGEAACLGSVMPLMKQLHCPGTDLIAPFVGNRHTPAVNLGSLRAGSIRAQTGAPAATAETFGLFDWDTTTAKCRQVAAWHKVLGVDRLFAHGFFQSVEGTVAHEAPPDYGPRTPIFAGMSELNRWGGGLETILDGARDAAGVAVLNSLPSYWDLAPGMDASRHEALRHALWQTVLSCLRAHVGIHLADEADVATATVSAGRLRVGKARYHTLLIPALIRLPRRTLEQIGRAARGGVKVIWFGNGPGYVMETGGRQRARPALPGAVRREMYPTEAWCRASLPPQVRLAGASAGDCYVRRFRDGRKQGEWLLAVNVSENDIELSLAGEGRRLWEPEQVDGAVHYRGGRAVWRLPACGSGLFRLGRPMDSSVPVAGGTRIDGAQARIPTGDERVFRPLAANRLRLDRPRVECQGVKTATLAFPRPYWELSDDFRTEEEIVQYVGKVPVVSSVRERDLRYRFVMNVKGTIAAPHLICEPRCARGECVILLNGRPLGGPRRFPLESTRPLRLRLTGLRQGKNTVELRFRVRSAMDGLLTQLFVEGDFLVEGGGAGCRLVRSQPRDSRRGWQEAGLPHYMGAGVYRWTHAFARPGPWSIEFDGIVDSADLHLDGRKLGRRAWAPWRWDLGQVRPGPHVLELRVHGTGGNLRKLTWSGQPQGWIGRAWLTSP